MRGDRDQDRDTKDSTDFYAGSRWDSWKYVDPDLDGDNGVRRPLPSLSLRGFGT